MADNRIYLPAQPFMPINNSKVGHAPNAQGIIPSTAANSFAKLLEKETEKLTFSQHALERIRSRNLQISEQYLIKINDAVEKIAQKGAKESLVYYNDMALVVSVQNRTVITAMDGKCAKETIFTNIDSAVIL